MIFNFNFYYIIIYNKLVKGIIIYMLLEIIIKIYKQIKDKIL